jgi:single-strand DNA-binding protein
LTVWGNVATEPSHVVSPNGVPRTTFRLAHTPRRKHHDGSFGDGTTSFFNVTCFGYVAVNAAASLHKGVPVVLVGDMVVREWVSDAGRAGRDVDLVASHIGPNLRWGRAVFERPPRPAPRVDEAVGDPVGGTVSSATRDDRSSAGPGGSVADGAVRAA